MFDALTQQAAHTTTLLAGTGFLDTANSKAAAVQVTLRALAGVASLYFIIKNAVSSGGAMARILVAGLAAAVFMYIVFNVTDLQGRVTTEVNAAGTGVTATHPATPQALALRSLVAAPVVSAAG